MYSTLWDISIGVLIGVLVALIAALFKYLFGAWQKKKKAYDQLGLISAKKVVQNPTIIMGKDRGSVKYGYRKDIYKDRENIDDCLRRALLSKTRPNNICILSGRYSSGKTRAIQELIIRGHGEYFKYVFKPDFKGTPEELTALIEKLPKRTLIVLDDINEFWERSDRFKRESFKGIFAAINEQDLPCVVTIADGVQGYQKFLDDANSDVSKGQIKGKAVLFLKIKDIEENDELHKWCTSNLGGNLYSKVIGGYIPALSRHTDVNIERILSQNQAVVFLAAYMILKKYRYQKCSLFPMVNRLYEVIVSKDHITGVTASLPALHDQSIDVLFDTGMLSRNWDDKIFVDDTSLFRTFQENCCTSLRGRHPVLDKYLSGTKEAERCQIIRLIEMDGDDPSFYSRAISKCIFPGHVELVGRWLVRKFFDGDPLRIKSGYTDNPDKLHDICFAIYLLIGRSDAPITLCRQMIEAGIVPSITMVSELLRAANTHKSPQDKKEIIQYALDVKQRYNLQDDIYFLQMMEICDSEYSNDRVCKAINLYETTVTQTEDEDLILDASFQKYCRTLAQKAVTSARMTVYFDLLKHYPGLSVDPRDIKSLAFRINAKQGAAAGPLLSQLGHELTREPAPTQIDGYLQNSGIISILMLCKDPEKNLAIYQEAVSSIEHKLNPGDQDSYLYYSETIAKMTYPLARILKGLHSSQPIVNDINDEIEKRIGETLGRKGEYRGAAGKLFNTLLNNQPMDSQNDSIDALIHLYKDKTVFPGERDIDNLNSLFESALRALPHLPAKPGNQQARKQRCEDLLALAKQMEGLRTDGKMTADGRYYYFMFRIIDLIQHTDKDFPVDSIRDLINNEAVEDNVLLLCQEVKLTGDIAIVIDRANKCLTKMKDGIIQMDLINHLMGKFCKDFPLNEELGTILNKLVEGSFMTVRHNVHDYQHYLEFFLNTGTLSSLEKVQDYLDHSWTALQRFGFPLREKKGDILCTAIKSPCFDFSETLSLVDFAIHYDRNCRTQDLSLFHFDTLVVLAQKFQKQVPRIPSDDTVREHLGEIQDIVYTLKEIAYNNSHDTMTKFKAPIKKAVRDRIEDFNYIRIPFESDHMDIRHDALMQRIDAENHGYFSSFELQQFIRQELFDINGVIFHDLMDDNPTPRETVREYFDFLALALEHAVNTMSEREMAFVNNDMFLTRFQEFSRSFPDARHNHFLYYSNFIQGYLAEGYIPSEDRARWTEIEHVFFGQTEI